MSNHEVAILGIGMHPWGKWGRNFVEYGVHAARAALADAGLEWTDVQFVAGGYGIGDVRVGSEVELVVETLFEDDDNEYRIWRWKPAERAGR